jgi:UDP-N-acetylmuramate dehydrogenase
MTSALPIKRDFSLRELNTFGIEARAQLYLPVASNDALLAVLRDPSLALLPRLVLGGGSNLLLTRDFPGLVLHMCTSDVALVGEDVGHFYVKAAAGENWHRFVQWTLAQGMAGLENLSLIPGSVGAAPIQNIGAYGIELKDRFHALTAIDLQTGDTFVLDRAACQFGYRDSIFKRELRDRAVILDVTFALPKCWEPNLGYADVARELSTSGIDAPTAIQVSEAVIAIRRRKLPDPAQIGNAGSFFKNPLISRPQFEELRSKHPGIAHYVQDDGSIKLAAGWLIDQCGWKGKRLGAAGVYERQALVLVNHGGASGQEVFRLAAAIQDDVKSRFGVVLEPEPVFI